MKNLIKNSGFALVMGGLCFVITNVILSPMVDFAAPYSEVLTSTPFFYRMSFAALTVVFLLFGSIGLYLYHSNIEKSRWFNNLSFLMAFFGSALIFANEWQQVFVLPDIAQLIPEPMDTYGDSEHVGSYTIGVMSGLALFTIGWILFMVSALRDKKLKRLGPILVLAGFLIIPLVSAIITPVWGGTVGSILLGIGFSSIGLELVRSTK